MAALTLQNIRDLTRAHADVDVDELTDDLIDYFAQEGYDKIVRSELRWPFFDTQATFTSADIAAEVTASGIPLADIGLEGIHFVRTTQWNLEYIDHERARRVWPQTFSGVGSPPTHWSIENQVLWLWPTLAGSYSFVAYGWRPPLDWVATGSGGIPDGPAEFSRLVMTYCLSSAYLQLGDYELGQMYGQNFQTALQEMHARFTQSQPAVTVILNGDTERQQFDLPPRLAYPFEPRV